MIDRDAAVFALGLTHFAAAGTERSSMTRIAADAGLNMSELKERFDTVDVLFDQAVAWGTADLRRDLGDLAAADDSPMARLVTMLRRIATATGNEQVALFAVYRELLDGGAGAAAAFETSLKEPYEVLVRIISEAQFRGQLAPLPPRFVLATLLSGAVLPQLIGYGASQGALHGVHASSAGDDLSGKPRNAMLAASLELLFTGALSDAARGDFPTLFLQPTMH